MRLSNVKYTTDGKYEVHSGKKVIAQSYVGQSGYEIKVLQGMDRMKTLAKIAEDCPEFLSNNEWDRDRVPMLFSAKK